MDLLTELLNIETTPPPLFDEVLALLEKDNTPDSEIEWDWELPSHVREEYHEQSIVRSSPDKESVN